jgi:hypothetical protein
MNMDHTAHNDSSAPKATAPWRRPWGAALLMVVLIGRHDLHLPDAPGDPAGPSGQLPQVRHDARADAARPGRRAENPELVDFKRRFWWTLPLTVVVTVLAMFGHRLGWFDMARRAGSNWCCRCRSCCGPAGRSSCAVRSRSSTAARTCGR